MTCKGVCIRYKADKVFGKLRYASGQKRCTSCEIWIVWDGIHCPCCNKQLKTSPNQSKYKKILRSKQQ